MYKILSGSSPENMKESLKTKTNYYNALNALTFSQRNVKYGHKKQLDMDYRPCLTWVLRFGTLHPKRLSKLQL